MLNQVFQVCRLVLFLLLGADRTELVPDLSWGLLRSHSDVRFVGWVRLILCECQFSSLGLFQNRQIDNQVLDAIIKSELGKNIFGSLDMLSHALSLCHPSELPFNWAHLVRTFMRLKNWVSDRYTHQGLLLRVEWLRSRLPVKEVPLDRVPTVLIQDPQLLFLLSDLFFERLPTICCTVLWAPDWVTQPRVLADFSIGQVAILRSQHLFLFKYLQSFRYVLEFLMVNDEWLSICIDWVIII